MYFMPIHSRYYFKIVSRAAEIAQSVNACHASVRVHKFNHHHPLKS